MLKKQVIRPPRGATSSPNGESIVRIILIILLLLQTTFALADTASIKTPPKDGMLKVAVVISDNANLIDLAGPWEVFGTTMLDGGAQPIMPFEIYTVAPSKALVHSSLTITPDYSFADAPTPDIVVLGAQNGGPGMTDWLKKIHAENKIIMSVCTGAYRLADTGLLDGKEATTHHWYFGDFSQRYPGVKLVRGVRYVQDDPITFSAGGLSSGIDLALHLVANYFGAEQAQKTADYLEYQGTGWKTNQGISELTTPVTHQTWSGELSPGNAVILHVTTTGASTSVMTDIPAQHVNGVATKLRGDGNKVHIVFDIAGHPASFTGQSNPGGTEASGTFEQNGQATPLTLKQQVSVK
jgi:putative intracellular protease/amidase